MAWHKQRTTWAAIAFCVTAVLAYMQTHGFDPELVALVEKLTLGAAAIFLRAAVEKSGPEKP